LIGIYLFFTGVDRNFTAYETKGVVFEGEKFSVEGENIDYDATSQNYAN